METFRPVEIKHAICVRSFRRMRSFHVVAAYGTAAARESGMWVLILGVVSGERHVNAMVGSAVLSENPGASFQHRRVSAVKSTANTRCPRGGRSSASTASRR